MNGLDAVRQKVVARVPWLEVETDEPFQTNLDGELMTGARVRYEIMPHALPLKLPRGSPLVL
jgi:diacylglycerol kinase family enzyme